MKDLIELKREFLEYCELDKGQSNLTIQGYDRYLDRFFEWLTKFKLEILDPNSMPTGQAGEISGDQKEIENSKPALASDELKKGVPESLAPADITQESIRQYRLYVNRLSKRGQGLKATTQNYHLLAIRAFLRYLSFRGIPCLSPEKISIAKTGDREITFLESEEIGNFLNQPDISTLGGLRDKAILELLFSTGMRVSECAGLNIPDLNFQRGEIAVLGKGRKLRVVFISENASVALKEYLLNRGYDVEGSKPTEEKTPLFTGNKKTRLTVRSIERIVAKYSSRAGILKKVSPHTLRHSFATDLLSSGADIRSVQSMLGHSSITTTQIYTHVTDQRLREIHQKYHAKKINPEHDQD